MQSPRALLALIASQAVVLVTGAYVIPQARRTSAVFAVFRTLLLCSCQKYPHLKLWLPPKFPTKYDISLLKLFRLYASKRVAKFVGMLENPELLKGAFDGNGLLLTSRVAAFNGVAGLVS